MLFYALAINQFASIPVSHSVYLKETNTNLKYVLLKIKYIEHKWLIFDVIKIIYLHVFNSTVIYAKLVLYDEEFT